METACRQNTMGQIPKTVLEYKPKREEVLEHLGEDVKAVSYTHLDVYKRQI